MGVGFYTGWYLATIVIRICYQCAVGTQWWISLASKGKVWMFCMLELTLAHGKEYGFLYQKDFSSGLSMNCDIVGSLSLLC